MNFFFMNYFLKILLIKQVIIEILRKLHFYRKILINQSIRLCGNLYHIVQIYFH